MNQSVNSVDHKCLPWLLRMALLRMALAVGVLMGVVPGQRYYPRPQPTQLNKGLWGQLPTPAFPGPAFPGQPDTNSQGQGTVLLPPIGGGLPTLFGSGQAKQGAGSRAIPRFPFGRDVRVPRLPKDREQDLGKWPSWVQIGGPGKRTLSKSDLSAVSNPARCLLTRLDTAVWVQPQNESAFYPLPFWDKNRVLAPGARVRLEGKGHAQLLFSRGTRIDFMHSSAIDFVSGDEDLLVLNLREIGRATCYLGMREVIMQLPDGSRLRGKKLILQFERVRRRAVWARGGVQDRLVIRNWGPGDCSIEIMGAGSETSPVILKPNRRSILPLGPSSMSTTEPKREPVAPLRRRLPGGGVPLLSNLQTSILRSGKKLELSAGALRSRVQWGGVGIRLSGSVTIDPIGGDPFGFVGKSDASAKRPQ